MLFFCMFEIIDETHTLFFNAGTMGGLGAPLRSGTIVGEESVVLSSQALDVDEVDTRWVALPVAFWFRTIQ
jgi:hypothetical protein